MASFAQQTGTGAKGKVANNDSLAAWYEKTLQLGGITVTGRAADKKVTVEKTSINQIRRIGYDRKREDVGG